MTGVYASIDIGSHTARLLVARTGESSSVLTPLVRERVYTRLAGYFAGSSRKVIPRNAVERLGDVLDGFLSSLKPHRTKDVFAAATGVMREAENRDRVLAALKRRNGLEVRCLSGEEEAALTSLGVVHALGLDREPRVIFDLGGGSTEVVVQGCRGRMIESLPLGASVLTNRWLFSNPPASAELEGLESEIDRVLSEAAPGLSEPGKEAVVIAGTGGTVTALAAVLEGLTDAQINPERVNGVTVPLEGLEELLERWKTQSVYERMNYSGLDEGRSEVIVAGAMVVRSIMRHFRVDRFTACMSDLLEGMIIDGTGGKI